MTSSCGHLVVGSGSIARRHIRNLKHLFPNSRLGCVSASGRALSASEVGADIIFPSIAEAIGVQPEFAIVASPAPFHLRDASQIVRAGIPVLIEKPLSSSLAVFSQFEDELSAYKHKIAIGYNLRFMESAIKFKELIDNQFVGRIHAVHVEVGQYLPDWRPGTDYRRNVSARAELGGGALLELSHELDYLSWIFGDFDRAYCLASRSDELHLDVEDLVVAILSRAGGAPVSMHLDFLQRAPARYCKVVGEKGTLTWNILDNSITLGIGVGDVQTVFDDPGYDRNQMYLSELKQFHLVARGEALPVVGIDRGADILRMIDALRLSAQCGQAVPIGDAGL